MASVLGSALMSLSRSIPGISKSFQDEEDRRLQREAGLLNLAKLRRENSQGEFEQRQRDIVSKNLDQYQKDVSEMDTVPQMMEAGPMTPDQYKRAEELTQFKEMSPLGRLQSRGLVGGAAYSPAAKSILSTELALQKNATSGTPGWKERAEDWKKIEDMPEGSEKDTAYMNYVNKWAPSTAFGVSDVGISGAGKKAATVQSAQIPGKVKEKELVTEAGINAEEEAKRKIPGTYKPTQYEAAGYANRIDQSEKVLGSLFDKGFDPGAWYNVIKSADATNAIKNPEQQQYAQAMRNFINATLRRESGAAIAKSEFDNAYKQYFSQLNDSHEVASQKRENRMAIFDAMRVEAGGAYDQLLKQSKDRSNKKDDNDPLGILD